MVIEKNNSSLLLFSDIIIVVLKSRGYGGIGRRNGLKGTNRIH